MTDGNLAAENCALYPRRWDLAAANGTPEAKSRILRRQTEEWEPRPLFRRGETPVRRRRKPWRRRQAGVRLLKS